jgi:hypothetical protein
VQFFEDGTDFLGACATLRQATISVIVSLTLGMEKLCSDMTDFCET